MTKSTARPGHQWSSNAAPALSSMSSGIARTASPLQHSLLPRSIDVSFSLRYRR